MMSRHFAIDLSGRDLSWRLRDPNWRRRMLLVACAVAALAGPIRRSLGEEPAAPAIDASVMLGRLSEARSVGDACLRSVQFVDAKEGWAVGDQGVIWHTGDGGVTWRRQASGVHSTLTSISMMDAGSGWIVGREPLPYNPASSGQILWTNDGGTWQRNPSQFLPGLNQVRLIDAARAWIAGETSDQHPTGLFFTENGGRTWIGARGPRSYGWLSGFFVGMDYGMVGGIGGPRPSAEDVADRAGRFGDPGFSTFSKGNLLPGKVDWLANSTVHDFAVSSKAIWSVGDRGQIFSSEDQGKTWKRPKLKGFSEVAKNLDFYAVSAVGNKIWIAGRPGSIVLHSADDGATWQIQKTGQTMPLLDLCFFDGNLGWAVGALGTILHTADGGANWQAQRRGGSKAALLWLNRDCRNVPLSVVARLGGNEGFLNVAVGVTTPDLAEEPPHAATWSSRFADGFRLAGGAYVETRARFPIATDRCDDDFNSILAQWGQLHEGKAAVELERDLVLAIRMYRPEVIATDALQPSVGNDMASTLVAMGVRRACQSAADPKAFPEQIETLGLQPHRAARVFGRSFDAEVASCVMSAGEIGQRLGASYADVANEAAPVAYDSVRAMDAKIAYQLIESSSEKAGDGKSFMNGLAIAPGSEARRTLPADRSLESFADAATKRIEKKRNVAAILERATDAQAERNLAQLKQMTGDLDSRQAGQVVFQMGRRNADAGRWELAKPAFDYLVATYPDHPLALEAYRWLIAYQSSGEARRRAPSPAVVGASDTRFVKPNEKAPTKTVQTSEELVVKDPDAIERWNRTAIAYGEQLRKRSPHLFNDPRIQLCLAAAQRQVGSLDQVKGILANVLAVDSNSRWAPVAHLENFLYGAENGSPPLGIAWTNFTAHRPKLDGVLDDECWKGGKRLPLVFGHEQIDNPFATDVIFRNDNEYLYVAAECRHPSAEYAKPKAQRTGHDADLASFDRLEIVLDPDRDYSTYYRLCVDQRGLVADDCWGDSSWNPKWYVATDSDEKGWRVEAAIPLKELADYIAPKETWAFNVQRVIPGRAVMAWNQPASTAMRPEGFGHLRFVRRAERAGDVLGGN